MEKEKKPASGRAIFRLEFEREEPERRSWSQRFSRSGLIWTAISAAVVFLLIAFCLIAFTPIRTLIPGYPDARSRAQAVQNAQRIDSLETQILRWELYTENLRRVVAGEDPVRLDSLIRRIAAERAANAPDNPAADSLLRAVVRSEEMTGSSTGQTSVKP